jgi:hypothetical protein
MDTLLKGKKPKGREGREEKPTKGLLFMRLRG